VRAVGFNPPAHLLLPYLAFFWAFSSCLSVTGQEDGAGGRPRWGWTVLFD